MPETLYLIDGHAQIFRAYYAIRGGMRSPVTSEATHAVFGVTGALIKLLSDYKPQYVVMATDTRGKTFRDDLYEEYKGTRQAAPDDLISQIPRVHEVTKGFGIPVIGQPGLEADDVIATIVQTILDDPSCQDIEIRIVSKDKDLEQLLCDRVTMFDIQTDAQIDAAGLMESKGIAPEQVIDLLALTGDTSDNVPGVEGIGPKTAAQLLQQFKSIEGIYSNLDQIKGKRRENLEKGRETLALSRILVTLKRDADIDFTLDAARVSPIDLQKLIPLFQQLGFSRYQDDVKRLANDAETQKAIVSDPFSTAEADSPAESADKIADSLSAGSGSGFENAPASLLDLAEPGDLETADLDAYEAISTTEGLSRLVEALRAASMISVDTETTGLGRDASLCGLSFSWKSGSGVYVPVLSPEPDRHLDETTALAALGPILSDPTIPKCGHNLKFDAEVLLRSGVRLRGVAFDSMLASALIDPSRPGKLDSLAETLLRYRMIPITDLIGSGEEQGTMDQVPLDRIVPYAAEDADIALRLFQLLAPQLESMGMSALMREIEAPLVAVIAEMETNGILCDPEELKRQGEALGERAEELRKRIIDLVGYEFRVESTQQLAEALFDRMGFAAGKKTKTGRSTDVTVLEKLAADEDLNDPKTSVPRLVIEYRQLTKLISTYLDTLGHSVDPKTGRIHSTFHQLVTATGRLASSGPNLQNIPIRTDIGRQIRKAFPASPGHRLICADYSQIELRLLAHLSGDAALLDAFDRDQDIHAAVAAQVFGVPQEDVTREQRSKAKTINFGIIYGVTPFGLARRVEGLDVAGATALIADYKRRFPGIDEFLQKCVHEALDLGYVTTIAGRRRSIPEIRSSNRNQQSLGERLAINTVVQGSAADLIKAAMVRAQSRIDRDDLPLKLLLQIHDELVFETPTETAETMAKIVCEEMEGAMTLRVPLRAEAGIGADWMSAK